MSWFQEVKPFFLVLRFHGFAPYSYVGGSPSESKSWQIYSYMIVLLRLFDMVLIPYAQSTIQYWNLQMWIVMAARSALSASSYITEGFVCCRTSKQLKKMIDLVNDYDRSLGINFATKFRAFRTWMIIALWSVYLGFVVSMRPMPAVWQKCLYVYVAIRGMGWFTMVLKFGAIANSFERRFEHLSTLLRAGTPSVIYDTNGSSRILRLNDVFQLHNNLTSAARIFNSMHNMALFFWICETTSFMITSIYRSMLITATSDFYKIGMSMITTVQDSVLLVYLLASCHGVSEAANKVGHVALSARSSVVRGRFRHERDEGFAIGHYFETNRFKFTAAYGIITVELPLLATILGGMTTILVVLTT